MTGTGSVRAHVENRGGLVSPGNSPGILSVPSFDQSTFNDGDFAPTAGTLLIEIAGDGAAGAADGFDQLQVTGDAVLGGIVEFRLLNGFVPQAGDTFAFLQAGAIVDDFTEFRGVSISDDLYFQPVLDRDAGTYSVEVVQADGLPSGLFATSIPLDQVNGFFAVALDGASIAVHFSGRQRD